ncbi:MAG: Tn3 family transposase [Deltaproteobacteria bacterium]|jgi:TnpA family transposase|nr:Tn3 family transposase [Deltaproteobacteria bacterium]
MTAESRRLSILTVQEADDLYRLPRFTEDERHLHFDLSPAERDLVDGVHTISVAAHLVLQLGYFKAKRQFFVYALDVVQDDLGHVLRRYFPTRNVAEIKALSKPTRLEQQQVILKLFGYHACDAAAKSKLEQKAQRVAKLSTQPIFILREVLQYLTNQRIVAPGYTYLQDMVGRTVSGERRRIIRLLGRALTPAVEQQLEALLQADEGMYRISILKHEPKDFSYAELRREVERRKFFQQLYEFCQTFLASAGLSNESVKYYATLVQFYTVYKLQRMASPTARLYLLCFAYHRFRQINDNLIDAFIHLVDQYEKQAKLASETAAVKAMAEASANLKAAGQVLNLFLDQSIADKTPFSEIKQKAFALLEPEQFALVSDYMRNIEFDKTAFEWSYYGALHFKFKLNLRHLFCALDFAGLIDDAPLLEAVAFLQELLRQGKSLRQANPADFPAGILTKGVQRYMYTMAEKRKDKRLEVDRYEFLVYRLLRNALEAGDVYVRDSNDFRSFEDDLISAERWKDKDTVLREIGAPILLAPIEETLAAFRTELESKFKRVNERIANGANKHIKLTGAGDKRRWSLIYPTDEEPVNSPFYGQLPGIGIADLLWFVAEKTDFLSAFTHVLERYVKQEADPRLLLACIVAMGTNMGLWKMAEVSGLSYPSLLTTARNFLRAETLHAANDLIANATAALPMFGQYDIDDLKHSSSDGQHIETQIHTINARHSSKFFGLKKGVNAYTLVSNHVPCNARIIGAHEHESHYVFDILYNNTTDIRPERHSTDTHGANQVNFFLLFAFGYQFAPRYRDLHKKMTGLVGFHHPKHYAHCLIKPARKTFDALIIREWPNIQRILASLAQKDVTQATIVRKLSSYTRQNQTKKALWELENIRRTIHILDFIDDPRFRQSVQKSLNRGEAYHRMRRAISYVNSGKFRVKTEAEQQIWNECSRLIANTMIYSNMLLLSRVYEQKLAVDDKEAIEILKGISPVAWRNFNLTGNFDFTTGASPVDIEALAVRYENPDFWRRSLKEEDGPQQ